MNIFEIRKEVRKIGPNYGVPCYIVEGGPGISYKNEALAKRLAEMGLRKKQLVVFKDCLGEIGLGTMVEGLKYSLVNVEVEAKDSDKDPGWFMRCDFWIIYWTGHTLFNLMGLRRGWDMVICPDVDKIDKFIIATKDVLVSKGVIGNLPIDKALELGVRQYNA